MKKLASIDVGLKRIGVAISLGRSIVVPKDAILRKNRDQASREVSSFLKEWEIDSLVVGIPLGGSSEDEMRRRIEHFVSLLDFSGDIFYQDEASSSMEAKELMIGITRQKRDGKIDSLAAKIILERYLENKF
jgi:putative Holliday junction resolvase